MAEMTACETNGLLILFPAKMLLFCDCCWEASFWKAQLIHLIYNIKLAVA